MDKEELEVGTKDETLVAENEVETSTAPLITAGDRECYVYFDMEFTGLSKNTAPMSIGLVDANGRTFYAEFTDYDEEQVTPWIIKNVIKNMTNPDNVLDGDNWTMTGTISEIGRQIYFWLDPIVSTGRCIQFVSDVCHYDFVLLIDILTNQRTALDLPDFISPVCVDLNQDIATSIHKNETKPDDMSFEDYIKNYVPSNIAFNVSRDEYAIAIDPALEQGDHVKHNSLWDAKTVRTIHQYLWELRK